MRSLLAVLIIVLFSNKMLSQQHLLFTEVLDKHVKSGLVDYEGLQKEKTLDKYLKQLTETNPDKFNRNEKLAFWINAYNAFTLQIVRDNYPVESITDLHTGGKIIGFLIGKTVWDKEFITINKKKYSLNYIEHEILRKMSEPRIHFAIVCAAISCPPLRSEAYEANKIDAQLEEDATRFLNDKEKNGFNVSSRNASLSKIFDWFDEDFGKNDKELLKYISHFLNEDIKNDISNNLNKWTISYKSYDWNLNKINKGINK